MYSSTGDSFPAEVQPPPPKKRWGGALGREHFAWVGRVRRDDSKYTTRSQEEEQPRNRVHKGNRITRVEQDRPGSSLRGLEAALKPQFGHSTAKSTPINTKQRDVHHAGRHSHSTVTAQSQHSHSIATALSQHETSSSVMKTTRGGNAKTALVEEKAKDEKWVKLMSKSLYSFGRLPIRIVGAH